MNTKVETRLLYRNKRKALSSTEKINASIHLFYNFQQLSFLQDNKNFAVYDPIDGEINPYPIIMSLKLAHKKILIPECCRGRDTLSFHCIDSGDICVPDVALVPLVAFDDCFNRLGFGKGWYDKTLKALRKSSQYLQVIGLAYEFQKSTILPIDVWDEKLDGVITNETIRLSKSK